MDTNKKSPRERAQEIEKTQCCNCDLDNWVPELSTGHSWVCRIHKMAMGQTLHPRDMKARQQ